MLSRELSQQAGQDILGDGCGGSKSELPGVVSAQRGDLVFSLNEERIRLPRVSQEHLASLRQSNTRSGAIEELDADVFLQRLDLETDRGLRQVQFFRSLAKAVLFRNCPEDDQAEVVQTRHATIRTSLHGIRCE